MGKGRSGSTSNSGTLMVILHVVITASITVSITASGNALDSSDDDDNTAKNVIYIQRKLIIFKQLYLYSYIFDYACQYGGLDLSENSALMARSSLGAREKKIVGARD